MLAEVHIYKTLAKSRPISSASTFLHQVSTAAKASQTDKDGQKPQQDRVKNNVTARLYNSNPVKEVMADILKAVQTSLGQGVIGEYGNPRAQKPQKDGNVQASSSGYLASNSSPTGEDMDAVTGSAVGGKERLPFHQVTGVSSSEGDQIGISKYENRIVDAKDKENSFDYSSMEGDGKVVVQGRVEAILDPKTDLSLSPPPLESSSTPSSLKSQKHKKSLTAPKSTFLPSLMGGYWSGSESAEDESEGLQPRKNRMGQRARRQLWEKKFGMKANHLRGTVRDKDWDSKKGAKMADNRGGPRSTRSGLRSIDVEMKYSRLGKAGETESLGKPRSAVSISEGPLHPSWEAAKKAKKQAMQATFQGKKIVFD
jgi:hypothetical protein